MREKQLLPFKERNMQYCNKCLENNWSFKFIDGWIRATCLCGEEVEFMASSGRKPKKNKIKPKQLKWSKGECTKCDGRVIARIATESQLKRKKKRLKRGKVSYYYSQYWRCLSCKRLFMDNRYKKII